MKPNGRRRAFFPAALPAAALCTLFASAAWSQEGPAAQKAAPQPPVRISAEAAEYLNAESLVIFTGKVVAVQGDTTITAERMEVRFTQPAEAAAGRPPDDLAPGSGQRVASITAIGSVTFRQLDPGTGKERYATGERGVYEAEKRVVTLTGAPRLWEGKNVIVGEVMDFFLEERKVVVKGKVNLTVYPDDAKAGARER
jgi:lipopolysaccharide export system protein LptA